MVMRAKRVYENIEFERGKDPKSAMDIGPKKAFKNKIRDLFLYDEAQDQNTFLIYNADFNSAGDGMIIGFDSETPLQNQDAAKYLQDLFKKFGLTPYINLLPVYAYFAMGARFYYFNLSGIGESLGLKNRRLWLEHGDYLRDGEYKSNLFHREFQGWNEVTLPQKLPPIDESLEFERGKDPKKSLGIGPEFILKDSIRKCLVLDHKSKNGRGQISSIAIENEPYNDVLYFEVETARNGGKKEDKEYLRGLMEESGISRLVTGKLYLEGDDAKAEYQDNVVDWMIDLKKPYAKSLENLLFYYDVVGHDPAGFGNYEFKDNVVSRTFRDEEVNESVDFERGQDPKKAIGIGKINQRDFESAKELAEFLWHYSKYLPGGFEVKAKETHPDYQEAGGKKYGADRQELAILISSLKFTIKGQMPLFSTRIRILDMIEEMAMREAGYVNESVDFERGQDPKKVLKIGAEHDKEIVGKAYKKMAGGDIDRYGDYWKIHSKKDIAGHTAYVIELSIEKEKVYLSLIPEVTINTQFYRSPETALEFLEERYYRLPESIDFERGKSPMDAMDLGRPQIVKRMREGIEYLDTLMVVTNILYNHDKPKDTLTFELRGSPKGPTGFLTRNIEEKLGAYLDTNELKHVRGTSKNPPHIIIPIKLGYEEMMDEAWETAEFTW